MFVLGLLASFLIVSVQPKLIFDVEEPLVNLPSLGQVKGLWNTSLKGRKFASFEGVPFAKPPIGDLRFKEPQPVEPWLDVWNATKIYICPQPSIGVKIIGNEDCLYLNIYVPETDRDLLDVVVFIHGGAFRTGNNKQFIGEKLVMDRDIILVAPNYRLGSLGFLSTNDDVVPGNNGLKDQVEALKWIQENIANFGGNPNSVTLTGSSAGAASVHLHYFSPLSCGLFHKGFSMSGTALNPWALKRNPLTKTNQLAQLVGCPVDNMEKLVECLKTKPASVLVEAERDGLFELSRLPFNPFAPVVEKHSSNPFLSQHPYQLLLKGKVMDVPWISSYTTEDGLIVSLLIKDSLDEINSKWEEVAEYIIHDERIKGKPHIAKQIQDYYSSESSNLLNFDDLTTLSTDYLFRLSVERSGELQSRVSKVYVYEFGYEGENSLKYMLSKDPVKGICHGDDVCYFFGGGIIKPPSKQDIRMQDICLDILYSFAHTGIPAFNNTAWKPVEEKLVYYLIKGPDEIKEEIKTNNSVEEFWQELGLLENEEKSVKKVEL